MTIEVVCGVIIRGGRILLTQRKATQDFPFHWECPGGKVEGNESHHEALRREIAEEIDIVSVNIEMTSCVCHNVERPDGTKVFVLLYRVYPQEEPKLRPLEGQGIGWFLPSEMNTLKLCPANEKSVDVIAKIMQYMLRQSP